MMREIAWTGNSELSEPGGRGVTQLTFEVVTTVAVTDGYNFGGREKSEKKKDKGGEMHRVEERKGGGEKGGGVGNEERTVWRNKRMKGEKKKEKAARELTHLFLVTITGTV